MESSPQCITTQNVSPGLAVCALFIPFINLVSLYNTANRIKLMQKADGSSDLVSPGAALLWAILFGIGYPIYIQGSLNNHWHEHIIDAPKIENQQATEMIESSESSQQISK